MQSGPPKSIPPEPLLHAAIGSPGQVNYFLNTFPWVQLPEGLQLGTPLEVHLFLIKVFSSSVLSCHSISSPLPIP